MTLHAIDQAWVEQVDYLQQLRQVISGRQYARHNAKFVFPQEAYKGFEKMQMEIRAGIMRNILLGEPAWEKDGKLRIVYPESAWICRNISCHNRSDQKLSLTVRKRC